MATSLDVNGLCEENFTCQGAPAVVSCSECGTLQCHACDEFFHVGKLASHTRRQILTRPLCERECDKIATVECAECGVKLCEQCDRLLHTGKRRSNHVITKLSVEHTTVAKESTEENVEEGGDTHSSFLLVNDKEELMVSVMLYICMQCRTCVDSEACYSGHLKIRTPLGQVQIDSHN